MKPLYLLKKAKDLPLGTPTYQVFDRKQVAEDWTAALNGDKKRYPTAYVTPSKLPAEHQRSDYFVIIRDDEVWEEQIAEIYGRLQRSEDAKSAEAVRHGGIAVDRQEMQRCWTNHLRRISEAAKNKRKLPAQIDDGSADDV